MVDRGGGLGREFDAGFPGRGTRLHTTIQWHRGILLQVNEADGGAETPFSEPHWPFVGCLKTANDQSVGMPPSESRGALRQPGCDVNLVSSEGRASSPESDLAPCSVPVGALVLFGTPCSQGSVHNIASRPPHCGKRQPHILPRRKTAFQTRNDSRRLQARSVSLPSRWRSLRHRQSTDGIPLAAWSSLQRALPCGPEWNLALFVCFQRKTGIRFQM